MKFIRTFLIVFILLISLGCNRSQENSFFDLKQAFIGWYLKSHPVISEQYNQLDNIDSWRDYSKDGLDEYFADLQRFFIELSQIDRAKLSDDLEFEYLALWSFLRNSIYFESKLNPYQFDLTLWAQIVENGLGNLNLECGTLTAREEKILKTRLSGMEEVVQNIKSHLEYPINILKEDGTRHLINIQNRMLTFLYECEVDSNLYERWDNSISTSYESLDNLIIGINAQKLFDFPNVDKEIWENGYEIYFGQFLEELITVKQLNNEIQKTYSKMLEIALPIYLKEYDEPIWVSKQDTIQVLKTVFNSFEEKNVYGKDIVQTSKDIINNLEYQFKNKYFKDFKYPKLDFKVGDSSQYYQTDYISNFQRGYRSNFYLPEVIDSNFMINVNLLEYHIINEIFPGKLNLNIQNSKSSKLLKLLTDDVFYDGWKLYIQDLLLNSKYIFKNPEVSLLLLENKLVSILKLKSQILLFDDEDYKIESELIFSEKFKNSLTSYWMNPFPTMDYLLLLEILELKKFHFKNDENDINSFNSFITQYGPLFIFVRQSLVD